VVEEPLPVASVRTAEIDAQVVGVFLQEADRATVVLDDGVDRILRGVRSAIGVHDVDPDRNRVRTVGEPRPYALGSLVRNAVVHDDAFVSRDTPQSRFGIAGRRIRRHRSNLDVAEAQRGQQRRGAGVLVVASRQPQR